ncbi:MAG: hypothetical protein H7Y60_10325 [Rhodospirillaceae bacterium]|nr:hypothetical protein [Rhodospirillales bacterium]
MAEEQTPASELSATEFLFTLAARLEVEADDKVVAKILAETLIVNAAPVDEVIGALNALAAARSKEGGADHD